MASVVQLEADDVGASFGGIGLGYILVSLVHGAKFLWQCS